MRPGVLLVLIAGCTEAFGVHQLPPPDGPPPPDDEDGDFVADPTDNCPGIANTDQTDGDHDGVGDACDPHAGSGDAIVSRAFFNSPADTGGWHLDDPAHWQLGSGAVTNNVGATINQQLSTAAYPTVEIGLDPVVYPSSNAELRVELTDPNGAYIACHIDYNDPTWDLYLDSMHGASVSPGTLRLVVGVDPAGAVCSINGAPTRDVMTATPNMVSATILLQNQLIASVRYIVVYAYTPP